MPAIVKTSCTALTLQIWEDSRKMGETNDCAVISACVLTGKPYAEVHAAFKAAGRVARQGTHWETISKAYRVLGFSLVARYWFTDDMIKKYPERDQILKGLTTHHPRRFPKAWASVKGNHLFDCGDHVAACVDNVVHDWSVNNAKRIKAVYAVLPLAA